MWLAVSGTKRPLTPAYEDKAKRSIFSDFEQASEEPLGFVAVGVQVPVVAKRAFAGAFGRDERGSSSRGHGGKHGRGVIGPIRHDSTGHHRQSRQQPRQRRAIRLVAGR